MIFVLDYVVRCHMIFSVSRSAGHTIEEIAWEKAGIIKTGIPVLTVDQHYTSSYPVLEKEAKEKETTLIRGELWGVS